MESPSERRLFYHPESDEYVEVGTIEEARHVQRNNPLLEDVTDEPNHEQKFQKQLEEEE